MFGGCGCKLANSMVVTMKNVLAKTPNFSKLNT